MPESADLRRYTGVEKLNKFFFFLLSCLICTPIFIPNFFQFFSSDTQPWYILILFGACIFFSKSSKVFLVFVSTTSLLFFLTYLRMLFGLDDALTKYFPILFFILFQISLSNHHIRYFLKYAFPVLIFHAFISWILISFNVTEIFNFLYSSRENFERSTPFSFPEASYAAKIYCLTGFLLIFYFGREKINQSRILFFLSIFTLSATGLIVGLIGLFYSLSSKIKPFLIFLSFLILLLILNDVLNLAGRLYAVELLIKNLFFGSLEFDLSLYTRFLGLENMLTEFLNPNFLGSDIGKNSVSIFLFAQFGILGFFYLGILSLTLLSRFLMLEFSLIIFLAAIFYSDTFIYPVTIFLMRYLLEEGYNFFFNRKYKAI